jgi:hypothetical protein
MPSGKGEILSPNLLMLIVFVSSLAIMAIATWVNVRIVKSKVQAWKSSSVVWFVASLGQFGTRQIEFWKRREGYDEHEARIIIKYQLLCFVEIPVGVVTVFILANYFQRLQ